MECKKCGKAVKKTDAFCQYCGTKIEQEEKKTNVATKSVEKKEEVKVEKVEPNKPGNGLAIAGMVLGILSILLSIIIGPFAIIFPLLGLILSLCSKKSGFKVAGIITSIVGFVIQIIWILIIVFFASLFGAIVDEFDDLDIDDDYNYNTPYKYASPYGEWTCEPYPANDYKSDEKTTLDFKYSGKFIYGPKGDLDNNHYSGTFTYEKEYDKNKDYTDREFIKVTAPVTEFKMNGIDQDASNKNLNMEMEFINDYDEAIIMFDNTANTYKCTK